MNKFADAAATIAVNVAGTDEPREVLAESVRFGSVHTRPTRWKTCGVARASRPKMRCLHAYKQTQHILQGHVVQDCVMVMPEYSNVEFLRY